MSGTVLVAGSANLDFVVRAAHVPAPGETVLGRDFATYPGGKGANQAVACARAGAPTRMLAAFGDDDHAAVIERSLQAAGVNLHALRMAGCATGTAFICVSDDAENAITVAPGANAALRPEHLPNLGGVSHLLLQLETPLATVEAWARAARAAGTTVILNAAPAGALPPGLLQAVDVLVVNEGELAAITGVRGDLEAALARLDIPCVIVTLGARGCCARVGGEFLHQAAYPVAAVDTTAAGDTFCGTLAAALAAGEDYAAALRRASAASALACTRAGAQSSVPARAEVDALLAGEQAVPAAAAAPP
ncbi:MULTISPECIES: ribokinase [unclassified Lysobacter]|uniref:ribokinase n=1 Tax=unclassified Lysobacter TaxID=2635362 RepID=UPI0006FF8446|nr:MULTISPECIES: ribokinase [unclassified Lysobacter]KQZ60042.1 ribokinase [Lysobacter sp. Root559]KRC38485.1 ribokinase [Lysobacter sp. Root76]KRD71318.1 ribokinase [Lysobacter sp. Root96]